MARGENRFQGGISKLNQISSGQKFANGRRWIVGNVVHGGNLQAAVQHSLFALMGFQSKAKSIGDKLIAQHVLMSRTGRRARRSISAISSACSSGVEQPGSKMMHSCVPS